MYKQHVIHFQTTSYIDILIYIASICKTSQVECSELTEVSMRPDVISASYR